MNTQELSSVLGNMDIYLIDAILKNRYRPGDVILDAGMGEGRNLFWFINHHFEVYGVDSNEAAVEGVRNNYPKVPADRFRVEGLENLSFNKAHFDAIICSAVLHFAIGTQHFFAMLSQLVRVLKPGGHLFIRMASNIGIEKRVSPLGDGLYLLPDGSTRFLLTRSLVTATLKQYPLQAIEPVKTTNVADLRCMTTWVLQKSEAGIAWQ